MRKRALSKREEEGDGLLKRKRGTVDQEDKGMGKEQRQGHIRYSQERQNPGICGAGMVTPQKRAKVMMMKGFSSIDMKEDGVRAEIV